MSQSPAKPESTSPRHSATLAALSAVARRVPPSVWRYVPALDALRTYSLRALGADMMAGLTVAAVAVPQAMAYATLAGLPPQYGLYTAIIMTAVGALFDSSRQLINGPTNAISITLLSALAVIPEADKTSAAVLFALLIGLIQLGITLLRLGDLTRYISHAVIVGFTLGAGVLLVLDQFKNLVGLPGLGRPEDHFLKRFWLTITSGHSWHLPTLLIGLGTIVLVVGGRRLNAWLKRRGGRFPIPQHLLAVAVMAGLVGAFDLEQLGVATVGFVPAALPSFEIPELQWERVQLLAGNAFGVAILGLLEALAMAKAIATQTGQRLDTNQQCLSEGMANLVGSCFHCMPGSGSLTRSAVNQQAGAVSQWSGVFSAAAVAATVLLFAPLAGYIPRAALAALLMLAAYRMVDGRQLLFHLRATRFDALIVAATALGALLISVEFCIVIGVFLSFVLYVPRAARVQLTELTPANDPRISAYELEGELFFGSASDLETHFAQIKQRAGPQTRVVLLDVKRGRNADAAFLRLVEEFQRRLRAHGVRLLLSGVRDDLADSLRRTGLSSRIGERFVVAESFHPGASLDEARRRAAVFLAGDPGWVDSVDKQY